jgi:hypothetical protein
MKTLHLTNCRHPESGGISTFHRELLRQAESDGRQMRLVIPGAEDAVEPYGRHCVIYHVRGQRSKLSPGYRVIMPASYLLPGGNVRKILVGERPDLVDTMRLLERDRAGQFHLLIAGDGLLRRDLERLCERELPGAVYFMGHIRDRATLADVYANCDVLLHPNPREPFGIAPLEAMASGLPIVGPDSGGITSYAHPGNAVLVKADAEAFANATILLRDDRSRTIAQRLAGRRTACEFDWPMVCSSFFALYEELCAAVRSNREPVIAPAFYSRYSDMRRPFGWQF